MQLNGTSEWMRRLDMPLQGVRQIHMTVILKQAENPEKS